jgi:hypothetical protein
MAFDCDLSLEFNIEDPARKVHGLQTNGSDGLEASIREKPTKYRLEELLS